jgi:hypothetical protein
VVDQDRAHQLVDHLVFDLLPILGGKLPDAVARLILLHRGLHRLLELGRVDLLAVDLQHHVTRAGEDFLHLAVREPSDEGDRDDPEHVFRDCAHLAQHRHFKTPASSLVRGCKSKRHNEQSQANVRDQ